MEIIWSPLAEETYLAILDYIQTEWTIKEAIAFDKKVDALLLKLKKHRNLCPASNQLRNYRCCVISKQTSVVYKVEAEVIELVAFIGNSTDHNW